MAESTAKNATQHTATDNSLKVTSTIGLHQRNANLDAIRGLALLGILFANIYFMGITYYGYAPHEAPPLSDTLIQIFNQTFIEGRFISLFSMLFGIGLYLQYPRWQAIGIEPYPKIAARLKYLMLFGIVHFIFIWPGDILLTYGVSGFVALHYKELPINALKHKAKIFIFSGFVIMAVLNFIALGNEPTVMMRGSELFNEQYAAWTGDYAGQLILHLMLLGSTVIILPIALMWLIAGLMLLGMAYYQQGVFEQGFSTEKLIKLIVAGIGLSSINLVFSLSTNPSINALRTSFSFISAIPIALIYIHLMVKWCQNSPIRLKSLQNVGKLAFSLYIFQSLCGVLLFRYIAPEWLISLDRWGYMAIAIALSCVQLLLAQQYLRYFRQGPLEALWRKLAYSSRDTTKMTTG